MKASKIKYMKASELRIGNYVSNIGHGLIRVSEIFQVKIYGIGVYSSDYTSQRHLKYTYPIPLTEEWLLKFGFELEHEFANAYKMYTTKHPYDCSNITYSINEKMLRFSNGQNKGSTLIPYVKHVHQLQNLYFALTGEELTLNL